MTETFKDIKQKESVKRLFFILCQWGGANACENTKKLKMVEY